MHNCRRTRKRNNAQKEKIKKTTNDKKAIDDLNCFLFSLKSKYPILRPKKRFTPTNGVNRETIE